MKRLVYVLAGLLILLHLGSCTEESTVPAPTTPRTFTYTYCLPNANDELNIVLDSVSADIVSITDVPSWLTLEQNGSSDTHPVLRIATAQGEPNINHEATVTVTLNDGNTVRIKFYQGLNFIPDENSNEAFLSDWENQDTVLLYTEHGFEQTFTPWARSYSSTVIPDDVRKNVKKKDGWEMAFSTLGQTAGRDLNYFGLYNKYLGILRVFYFVTDASTNGTEHSFEINLGSNKPTMKYPFYNALAYSIPTSHTSVNNALDLSGTNNLQTFKVWTTPYTSMSSSAITTGWTAFDIDMSGYVPAGKDYLSSSEAISIACRTVTNQEISLAGLISADISGKYSSAATSASSSSGLCSTLSSMSGQLTTIQNSILAQIDKAVSGKPYSAPFYYAGAICNTASYVYDWIMGDDGLNEETVDSLPGKIELNLTGEISLNGYIKSFSSNQISPLTFETSVFRTTNPNTSVGKGVWNLAEDPVVYIVDDHYLGATKRINLTVGKDHTYLTSEGQDNEMRLISFLDPTTVKLNLNTELFPDAEDVEVVCYYGVYPYQSKGHTDQYRNLMQLSEPATIDLVDRNKMKEGDIYRTTNSGNKMTYHQIAKETLISRALDEKASLCSTVKQKGSNYKYYGRLLSEGTDSLHAFMMDPQVFFPVSSDGTTIYDGETPDFVVSVFVTFRSNGRNYQFSRRFLPQVKLISGNDLKTMQTKLQQYVTDSKNGKEINFVNNGMSIGVKHPNATNQMEKTLNILQQILQ